MRGFVVDDCGLMLRCIRGSYLPHVTVRTSGGRGPKPWVTRTLLLGTEKYALARASSSATIADRRGWAPFR